MKKWLKYALIFAIIGAIIGAIISSIGGPVMENLICKVNPTTGQLSGCNISNPPWINIIIGAIVGFVGGGLIGKLKDKK